MRLLVTGGSGAIGSFVVRELRGAGHEVTVFDLDPPSAAGVAHVPGDVTDADAVRTAVTGEAAPAEAAGTDASDGATGTDASDGATGTDASDGAAASGTPVDAVVHLAALLPDACRGAPPRAEAVNVGGSLAVFEAAAAAGARVVYASSKAVLGPPTGRRGHPRYEPVGEDAPRSPASVYGVTKRAVEDYADAYRADGLTAVGLRFASTYGPGKGAAHGDLAVLPGAVRRAAAGEAVHLPGGDQRNDLVYYGDVARGVRAAVEADAPAHGLYHVGSGEAPSVRRFAAALRERADAAVTVEGGLNYRDADDPSYCRLDVSRARADLGYEPAYPVERGVADFLDRL